MALSASHVHPDEQAALTDAAGPFLDVHRQLSVARGVPSVDIDRSSVCNAVQTVVSASGLSTLHQMEALASAVAAIAVQSAAPNVVYALFGKMLNAAICDISAAIAPKGNA